MQVEPSDDDDIKQYVEKKLEAKRDLSNHLLAYLFANAMMFMLWLYISIDGGRVTFPWFIIILFGWSIGLFAHYRDYSQKYGVGREKYEVTMQYEIEKERQRRKPTNRF